MFNKILGKLYFYNYLRHNPTQTKDIDCLIQQPKKILIISNTAFGDLLLSTPAMQSIRVSFNSAQIALLAQKQMLPLAKNFTFIDEFFPFFGGYKNFIQTSKQLYKFKPCLVLILHGNYPQDIQLAYLSGARFILKHPTNSKLKHILSYQFKKEIKHAIETRLDLVKKIGATHITNTITIGNLDCNSFKFLSTVESNAFIVGLQLGASDTFKMWPIEYFQTLLRMILSKYNKVIFITTGIMEERYLAQKLVNEFGDRVINNCGCYNINELPCLVKKFQMLITNDTGTLHLAIALKIPTISLFSPTNSIETGPYQDMSQHVVIQKKGNIYQDIPKKYRDNHAMKYIQPDEVYVKFEQLYKELI